MILYIPVLRKYSFVVHFDNDGAKGVVEVIVIRCRCSLGASYEHKEESSVLKGPEHHGGGTVEVCSMIYNRLIERCSMTNSMRKDRHFRVIDRGSSSFLF